MFYMGIDVCPTEFNGWKRLYAENMTYWKQYTRMFGKESFSTVCLYEVENGEWIALLGSGFTLDDALENMGILPMTLCDSCSRSEAADCLMEYISTM